MRAEGYDEALQLLLAMEHQTRLTEIL